MHNVAVLAFPGVVPFDLAVPCEVFGRAVVRDARPAYTVRVHSTAQTVDAGPFCLQSRWALADLYWADTVVIPGVDDIDRPLPIGLIDALYVAAGRGARLVSLCSGAFMLAATGLLDGHAATTHWAACSELARRHPTVCVDPAVLYVDEGQLLTSAGAAASLDLCLHLVRRDLGAAAAAATARLAVMPLERAGGQAQFIGHPTPNPGSGSLERVLRWAEVHLDGDLSTASLARRATMSERTFGRRFREQTGSTPAKWVTTLRIRRSQVVLETTGLSIDEVATSVGFGSTSTFREAFVHTVGTSPTAWRRTFRAG